MGEGFFISIRVDEIIMLTKPQKTKIGKAILAGATTGDIAREYGVSRKTAWVTFRKFCYLRIFLYQYERAMESSNKIKALRREYFKTQEILEDS